MKRRVYLTILSALLAVAAVMVWGLAPTPTPAVRKQPSIKSLTNTEGTGKNIPTPVAQEPLPTGTPAAGLVLTGTVAAADTGRPIPSFETAFLEEIPANGGVWKGVLHNAALAWQSHENEQGVFRLENLPIGKAFALAVRAEGYLPQYKPIPPMNADKVQEGWHFQLAPETGILGRVTTVDGTPIYGAAIHLGDHPSARMAARSDKEGRFRILREDTQKIVLQIIHPDYLPKTKEIPENTGPWQEITVVLNAGGAVQGVVARGDTPVDGAVVTIYDNGITPKRVHTDNAGRYRIQGLPSGEVEVHAVVDESSEETAISLQHRATITEGASTPVDFRFPEVDGTISGTITVAGVPVAGGYLEAEMVGEEGDAFRGVRIGPGGAYQVNHLTGGSVWMDIRIQDAGGIQRRKQVKVDLTPGEQREMNIDFNAPYSLPCVIKNIPEGAQADIALLQGKVSLRAEDPDLENLLEERNIANRLVEADGEVLLDGIEAGEYTLVGILSRNPDGESKGSILGMASIEVAISDNTPTATLAFDTPTPSGQ